MDVVVTFDKQYSGPNCDRTIQMSDIINEIPNEEYIELAGDLYGLNAGINIDVSIRYIIRMGLTGKNKYYKSLPHLLLVAERLKIELSDINPNTIKCSGLDEHYQCVVADVAAELNVPVKTTYDVDRTVWQFLSDRFRFVLYTVALTLTLVVHAAMRPITSMRDKSTEIVFMPYRGRFDSMVPVIKKSKSDFAIISKIPFYQYLYRRLFTSDEMTITDRNGDVHNIKILVSFASMTGIFNGWRDILKIVTTDIESAYAESIETEFGIHASRTVSHVFAWEVFYRETGIFHQNFAEALMYYPVALEMFDRTNCDKVVLGSGGKREAAIACAAEQRNVDVYYVAHGIEHAGTHTKATSLVSGELAVEQHKIHTYGVTDSNLTVTGRPYLTNLYDQFENVWTENGEKPEEPLKLIVLTTGHRDKIRTRFVKAVLSSARNSSIDFDITIKIHPNETKAFYQNLLSTLSIVGVNNIRIETDDLFGHLYRADIAATTVSNAGLEAIITGTPCISVQLSNLGQPQFYTELTSIPKLKNENEVEAFFRSLTIEDIWKIRNEQMDDVQDAFVLSDDAAENMAQVIDNE